MKQKDLFLVLFCFFCFILHLNSSNLFQTPQQNYRLHTVTTGETVYSIASKYNISVEDIYTMNPEARQRVRVNQEIKIPAEKKNTPKDSYILHSIQPKETLYAVSKHYDVSVEDILAANPGLNATNFRIGTAIYIPRGVKNTSNTTVTEKRPVAGSNEIDSEASADKWIRHTVQSKETLYSLSKLYNVSIQEIVDINPQLRNGDGLKKNMVVNIPASGNAVVDGNNLVNAQAASISNTQNKSGILKIGLLLPFFDKKPDMQARFIEYYEGFLLAVENIKAKGYSAEIYTFDIRKGNDNKKLESLLETTEMKNLDFVIGGVTEDEISRLSTFAQKENVKYAVPFPVKNNRVVKGDNTFQVNVSPSDLCGKVANIFSREFKDYNVILLMDEYKNNDKKDFIDLLKKQMTTAGISFHSLEIMQNLQEDVKSLLSSDKKNIIIPSGSSLVTLNKIMPGLRLLKNENPELTIHLFGYPEWQTYSTQFLNDFYKFGSYIYTPFYADNNDSKVKSFMENYMKWYGKTLINTYPKYGLLGYDAGLYFMTALEKYGQSFGNSVVNIDIPTLQSSFYFEKLSNEEGYINTGLFFIHYKEDMTIEKINYSK